MDDLGSAWVSEGLMVHLLGNLGNLGNLGMAFSVAFGCSRRSSIRGFSTTNILGGLFRGIEPCQ